MKYEFINYYDEPYRICDLTATSQEFDIIKSRAHLDHIKAEYEEHFEILKANKVDKSVLDEEKARHNQLKCEVEKLNKELLDRDKKYILIITEVICNF